jgi:flagellum-specific peptidoglycan hydrolase FlgJ
MSVGNRVANYLRQNWFKIGIAIVLIFLLTKKDLTFNINLRTPAKPTNAPQEAPAEAPSEKKTKEILSEQTTQPVADTKPKKQLFDLSSIFSKKEDAPTAFEQLSKIDDEIKNNYLKRFARVAVTESGKFNIPASIILANAMLHSQAGTTPWAREGNNQFALGCTEDWRGEKLEQDDACYRSYENAWTSFRDHSFYVTTGSFEHLRRIDRKDYKGWAKGLERAGFSEEKNLAEQLIQVIEAYELTQLDEQ